MTGLITAAILVLVIAGLYYYALRRRNMHQWLGTFYVQRALKAVQSSDEPVDLFIAICDHYEPQRGNAPKEVAIELVERWCREYPSLFSQFHDSSGRVPQHSFFFPQDEYQPEYLDALAELCAQGYGDVDIHLHHDHDTAEGLREKLCSFRDTLYHRHGLLRKDPVSGKIVYGFIHGNWSLCNSHPQGLDCGLDQEIPILLESGCYADFTMPSAPSPTQTRMINSIYYAIDQPGMSKSHDTGVLSELGKQPPQDSLLMIQGPLTPDWSHPKMGIFPRIENSDLHGTRPPTWDRLQLWLKADVHVAGVPNWKFVKLHTHGCKEGNIDMLLGPSMQAFHRDLQRFHAENSRYRYHYVTAWEMAQLVRLAEQGQAKHGVNPLQLIQSGPVSAR